MAPNAEETRARLIGAAEALFAERGIHGVSLREINAAAGQRNTTALQYHFTDRRGLLAAVLAKHHASVDVHRHALLDEYEQAGSRQLRPLTAALTRPLAAKLGDADGGRSFLRIYAEVLNVADRHFGDSAPGAPGNSVDRWRRDVAPLLPEVAVRRLHHRFTAIRVTAMELARRAAAAPRRDDRLFTSHLTDVVTALLSTPVSEETADLLASRASPGQRRGSRANKPSA